MTRWPSPATRSSQRNKAQAQCEVRQGCGKGGTRKAPLLRVACCEGDMPITGRGPTRSGARHGAASLLTGRRRSECPPSSRRPTTGVRVGPADQRPLTTTGRAASGTDARTWSTHKNAAESVADVGMGFVLSDVGMGFVFSDVDDVVVSTWTINDGTCGKADAPSIPTSVSAVVRQFAAGR